MTTSRRVPRVLATGVALGLALGGAPALLAPAPAHADPPVFWQCQPHRPGLGFGTDEITGEWAKHLTDPTDTGIHNPDTYPNVGCAGNELSGENLVAAGDTWAFFGERLEYLRLFLDDVPLAWHRVSDTEVAFTVPPHADGYGWLLMHNSEGGWIGTTTLHYVSRPTVAGIARAPGGGPRDYLLWGSLLSGAGVRVDDRNLPTTAANGTSLRFTLPEDLEPGPDGRHTLIVASDNGAVSTSFAPDAAVGDGPVVTAVENVDHANQYRGVVGSRMTVEGVHLAGATASVDGVPVDVTRGLDDRFTITLPRHARGVARLVVTTPAGTTSTAVQYLTASRVPVVTSVARIVDGAAVPGRAGAAGDRFLLTGRNLGGTVPWFGDEEWTPTPDPRDWNIRRVSADALEVTLPSGPPRRDLPFRLASPTGRAVVFLDLGLPPVRPAITGFAPGSGPSSGGTVLVKGRNLSPLVVDAVLGGRPLPVEYVDATTLRVVLPPHAPGRVSVRVSDGNGHVTTTRALAFRYR